MVRMRNIFRVYSALHQWRFWVRHYVLVCLLWTISLITKLHPWFHSLSLDIELPLRRNFLHSEDHVLKLSLLSLRKQIKLNSMQLKKKLYKIKANLKLKLAESFCRNFVLQSRNIAQKKNTSSLHWVKRNEFELMQNFIQHFLWSKKMKMLKS